MADGIEDRLTAASAAHREHELTAGRCAELGARIDELAGEVATLQGRLTDEQADVERLEGVTLTRLVASLRGARDDALARERAEADAARYRLDEAMGVLDAMERELDAARARLAELADAPATYAAVLDDKERHLAESGDPLGPRLLELADERGRLTAETREVSEALEAARLAREALADVAGKLGSASNWSTYDTFFGGGALSSVMKHSRLDEAGRLAARADKRIAVLRRELADVAVTAPGMPSLPVDGMTRFVDIWFDNVLTDFLVAGRINKALENVAASKRMVRDVEEGLRERGQRVAERLSGIETDRRRLLDQP